MRRDRTRHMWDMLPREREIANAALDRLCRALDQLQVLQAREDEAFQAFMTKALTPQNATRPTSQDAQSS